MLELLRAARGVRTLGRRGEECRRWLKGSRKGEPVAVVLRLFVRQASNKLRGQLTKLEVTLKGAGTVMANTMDSSQLEIERLPKTLLREEGGTRSPYFVETTVVTTLGGHGLC